MSGCIIVGGNVIPFKIKKLKSSLNRIVEATRIAKVRINEVVWKWTTPPNAKVCSTARFQALLKLDFPRHPLSQPKNVSSRAIRDTILVLPS